MVLLEPKCYLELQMGDACMIRSKHKVLLRREVA